MHIFILNSLISLLVSTKPVIPLYEQDIRPILKAHCFECHGEGEKLKGGLDLRLKKLIVKGGDSGTALVEKAPEKSLLIEKILSQEMPPGKRKLNAQEIELLNSWISNGAKTAGLETDIKEAGFIITDNEKKHWSFKKISSPKPPSVSGNELVKNPIDAFVLKKLESKGLKANKNAEKHILLRRIFMDLIGMPPTPEQLRDFIKDNSIDAYEKQIDMLLASKHYGERWGRHWLDVAGYADSEGFDGSDIVRTNAYHFRDYVIKSLNNNKPFDQFIMEQLAGDEMISAPYETAPPVDLEKLIATGFLRLAPDGSSSKDVDIKLSSNQTIADTIQIVSTSLMGITVQCAQCHNHRYDPISQSDYYRMRAIFEPALNWKEWKTIAGREIKIQYPKDKSISEELEKKAVVLDKKKAERQREVEREEFNKSLEKVPTALHGEIKKAFETPIPKRTPEQKKLLSNYPNSNVNVGLIIQRNQKLSSEFKSYTDEIERIRSSKPTVTSYRVLTEVPGKVPVTNRFERGDYDQPKETIKPGHFQIFLGHNLEPIPEDDPSIPTTGRRLAFAKALVSENHPLTARVLVNRFWMHHFGKGIVENPGDFGKLGSPPSHPELLDWLASTFIKSGWNLKEFHKLVMTSNTYKQSSVRTEELQRIDPDNILLGRMNVRRMESESLRDSILKINSKLNEKTYGPPVPITPDDYGQIIIGTDTRDGAGRFTGKKVDLKGEEFRRSIYIQVRRSTPLAVFESFDFPIQSPNCEHRNFSTTSTQSLLMLNSQFIQEQSEFLANKLQDHAPSSIEEKIKLAWNLVFTCDPTDNEMKASLSFIKDQQTFFSKGQTDKNNKVDLQSLTIFCQAMLISNRFLYID